MKATSTRPKAIAVYLCCLITIILNNHFNNSGNAWPAEFSRRIIDTNPPVTPLSPEESISKVQLAPGFHLQLVASEPMVQEPVSLAWDGNGRLFVVEMNTF